MALLIHRINRLRRIPSQSEVKPAKLVFIKQSQDQIPHESVNQRYLQKASEFISDKYSENLNSEDVAKQIGLSLRKFQRITKEELNCTPTNFMYLVKLNKAADYIRNNHGNISEIAYQFGFSSPSYFSKMFKSHFGVSPVEYKNSDNSLNENVSKH
jgi:AraC-like DNA-binding protein